METKDRIRCLFYGTKLTQTEIAERVGVRQPVVSRHIRSFATPEERAARTAATYGKPLLGHKGAQHPRWRGGESVNGHGYRLVQAPEWWAGYLHGGGDRYVLEHQLRVCEFLGLDRIPKGYAVHHKDRDKLNNSLDNLQYMTQAEHIRLHNLEGW